MSSDYIEKTHRAYEAMQSRDFATLAELSHPDVEFTSLIRESEGTVYRGHEGLREYLESLVEVLPDWSARIEGTEEQRECVLVKARISATPAGGSVPIEQTMWQVIRFRDGLAIRWDFFRTEQEARDKLPG